MLFRSLHACIYLVLSMNMLYSVNISLTVHRNKPQNACHLLTTAATSLIAESSATGLEDYRDVEAEHRNSEQEKGIKRDFALSWCPLATCQLVELKFPLKQDHADFCSYV